jgi:hypothetical protein
MKDSNRTDRSNHSGNLEDALRTEAQRIPAPEQSGLVAQVMRNVRASPRMVDKEGAVNGPGWTPWLLAGATAAAALVIAISVTSVMDDSSTSSLPRQANLPRIVESRVDPVLASREQDLIGELQRIRADLDSIGRMVSIRLESGSR